MSGQDAYTAPAVGLGIRDREFGLPRNYQLSCSSDSMIVVHTFLDNHGFLVFTEGAPQRVGDFAHRRI